jgi:hypothetical protein
LIPVLVQWVLGQRFGSGLARWPFVFAEGDCVGSERSGILGEFEEHRLEYDERSKQPWMHQGDIGEDCATHAMAKAS